MYIEKILTDKFLAIVAKHQNPIWAREELEWLIFDKYRWQYEHLNKQQKKDISDYFDALIKLHGGR